MGNVNGAIKLNAQTDVIMVDLTTYFLNFLRKGPQKVDFCFDFDMFIFKVFFLPQIQFSV